MDKDQNIIILIQTLLDKVNKLEEEMKVLKEQIKKTKSLP